MQQEKEAMEDITEYIEIFYNRKRIEEKLNYLPPIAYGQSFYKNREAGGNSVVVEGPSKRVPSICPLPTGGWTNTTYIIYSLRFAFNYTSLSALKSEDSKTSSYAATFVVPVADGITIRQYIKQKNLT